MTDNTKGRRATQQSQCAAHRIRRGQQKPRRQYGRAHPYSITAGGRWHDL
jgi:hypothetical protein